MPSRCRRAASSAKRPTLAVPLVEGTGLWWVAMSMFESGAWRRGIGQGGNDKRGARNDQTGTTHSDSAVVVPRSSFVCMALSPAGRGGWWVRGGPWCRRHPQEGQEASRTTRYFDQLTDAQYRDCTAGQDQ